jgi:hypothetical protein
MPDVFFCYEGVGHSFHKVFLAERLRDLNLYKTFHVEHNFNCDWQSEAEQTFRVERIFILDGQWEDPWQRPSISERKGRILTCSLDCYRPAVSERAHLSESRRRLGLG